jgi:uncharacterized protein
VFVVDTNVFVYAADVDSPEHERCRSLLEGWRLEIAPWFSTWNVLYEFARVVTHPRVFRRPWRLADAQLFIDALLASPTFSLLVPTGRHAEVLRTTAMEYPDLRGNLLHDAHTAVLMREHGIRRVYTRDTDFSRFKFLEVLDPLALAVP